ncbi:MAG: CBS domain-containing protein [Methylococcales bacterium]|nr:CBS domain-containing protein [Methylococcales bacterium]MDD5632748.1 CBS domain-containing protein [Methylococcales bacterium]
MTLKTICNREVLIAQKYDTLVEAAKLMREYQVGSIVVVEEQNGLRYPAGIVTDRDLVIEVIAKEVDINSVTLGDVMYRDIILGKENDDVNETIKIMRQKGIRRLPVVDDNGALVGIVTLDDLIDLIAEQLKDIAALIGKQQNVEKRYR